MLSTLSCSEPGDGRPIRPHGDFPVPNMTAGMEREKRRKVCGTLRRCGKKVENPYASVALEALWMSSAS